MLERAARDHQFRDKLKQDPRGTVARDFGVQVPAEITVEVVEETPSKVYLLLPPTPAQGERELSAEELEAVAGGWTENTGCGSCGDACI